MRSAAAFQNAETVVGLGGIWTMEETTSKVLFLGFILCFAQLAVSRVRLHGGESETATPRNETAGIWHGQLEEELRLPRGTILWPEFMPDTDLDGSVTFAVSATADVGESNHVLVTTTSDPSFHPDVVSDSSTPDVEFGDWPGYNSIVDDFTFLAGNGDRLGMISSACYPTLDIDSDSGITFGYAFHFLSGPTWTDLPPRLFDVQIAYQSRKLKTKNFILDYRLGLGVFSDFEGSARKGVRFPGHAVSYYEVNERLISVLGVESLDRDDISLLPVVGCVWRPHEDLIFDLVFPKPKAQIRLTAERIVYVAGELGGGTWAIERDNHKNDNATYRDLQLLLGMTSKKYHRNAFEVGWSFARKLEFRSSLGNYRPEDTLLFRLRTMY